jgi:two-component system, sensor histidine kinase PdtaS
MLPPSTRRLGGKPGGIRAAIVLLILIPVLVPLFAALVIWLGERESAVAANERVESAARVASATVSQLVESTRGQLQAYDEKLGPNPARFRARPATATEGLFALYDASGRQIGSGGDRGTSVADDNSFKALAAGKPWLTTPLLGAPNSLRFFGIARRIERDGKFAGVVTAYLSADVLSNTWSNLALGPESTVGLIRADGWLVTRYPVPQQTVDLSGAQLFDNVRQAPQGVFVSAASPVDGVARRVAYRTLPDLGLIVVASISRTSATDALWSRIGSAAIIAGPIFIAMLFMCGWAIVLLLRHEKNRVALERALADNRMLFQEIHHRVKNNLQQVASLIRLQQAPAQMKEDLTRRIVAMSAVHQHIYESGQFGVLDAEAYLARVLTSLRDSAPPGVTLEWKLAPLQLSPDQALPLGMIVNEVVSNAFKHGFPNGRAGNVAITLVRPLEGNDAVLTIADDGVGMSETPTGGIGLGTRLIKGLAGQLQGEASVTHDEGVKFELKFPVEQVKDGP